MADDSLVERLRSRTDRELEALGEGFERQPAPPTRQPVKPAGTRPVERVGVGRDLVDETTRVIIAGLDARLKAAKAAGNASMVAELEARRKAILAEAELAKK